MTRQAVHKESFTIFYCFAKFALQIEVNLNFKTMLFVKAFSSLFFFFFFQRLKDVAGEAYYPLLEDE